MDNCVEMRKDVKEEQFYNNSMRKTMKMTACLRKDCIIHSLKAENSTKYDDMGSFEKYKKRVDRSARKQMQSNRVKKGGEEWLADQETDVKTKRMVYQVAMASYRQLKSK